MSVPVQQDDWAAKVNTQVSDITGRGGRFLLVALAAFGAWAALIPLNSAVLAPGAIVTEGKNKLLQHRTGGTVREIFALEGETVAAGDPVVALDPNIDRAQLTRLRAQYALALAMKSRLEAERDFDGDPMGMAGISLRGQLDEQSRNVDRMITTSTGATRETGFDDALNDAQQQEFDRGREAIAAELEGLQERIEAQEQQYRGLAERAARTASQVDLLRRQFGAAKGLVSKDYLPRQQLWDIESRLLEREAEMHGLESERDALANSIAETHAQMSKVRSSDQRAISEKLSEVLTNLEEVKDQLAAAEVGLRDTIVRSPVAGTLVHMKTTTVGGVVPPGEAFGEIVPSDAALEVEARVSPQDISAVAVGHKAKVKVTALNPRTYDDIPAVVTYVAADSTLDERTGQHYFQVRVRFDPDALTGDLQGVLTPGMAGEVFLEGQSRTFLSYLMQPLTDSLSRAFKETR